MKLETKTEFKQANRNFILFSDFATRRRGSTEPMSFVIVPIPSLSGYLLMQSSAASFACSRV